MPGWCKAAPIWAQSISDIPADPSVLFGTLPNGMRYAILKNATPPDQVSFRFRFDVGSLHETPEQRGIAHFLEHMAFRGSTHVPDGEAFRRIERLGGSLGADTNAFTGLSETVYMFNLPHPDEQSTAEALTLMRETASELSLKPETLDSERKVVLSEERLGDQPNFHVVKDKFAFLYHGQPIGDHLPIGDPEVIKNAGPAAIRSFYNAYYRPERATLIVVGDIDPAKMAAKIKSVFTNWRGRGAVGRDPKRGPPERRGQEIKTHIEVGAQPAFELYWTEPFDEGPDSKARETRGLIRGVAYGALNQRFQDMAHQPDPPFIGAQFSRGDMVRSAKVASLGAVPVGDNWQRAMHEAVLGLRTAMAQGLSQEEIDRQIAKMRKGFETAVAGANTRLTPSLANGLLGSVDAGTVFRHPSQNLAQFDEAMRDLSIDKVNAMLRESVAGNGPLIFASGPKPVPDLDDGLREVWANAQASTEARDTTKDNIVWPYTSFGAEGRVASQSTDSDLGTTEVTFENGVHATIKPTKFHKDQILVSVYFGDGMRVVAKSDSVPPAWAINSGAFIIGGLKDASITDIQHSLSSKITGANLAVRDRFFVLAGQTRPQDFATELQLMTAYFVAPAWRQEAFEAVRSRYREWLPQQESSPSAVFGRDWYWLLHNSDKRWSVPTLAEIDVAKLGSVQQLLAPSLEKGPIKVVVVGDVDTGQAIADLAATMGTLPSRDVPPETLPPQALDVTFPAANATPMVLHHKGRSDQAIAFVAWPIPDALHDLDKIFNLEIARHILSRRLFDEFRTKLGGSYSPNCFDGADFDVPGFGYLGCSAETPPDKIPVFDSTMAALIADLKANPVGADEFERMRKPMIETMLKNRETNGYWINWLSDPARERYQRERLAALQRATPESVQRVVEEFLNDGVAWKMEVVPTPPG